MVSKSNGLREMRSITSGSYPLSHQLTHGLHRNVSHSAVAQNGDVRALPDNLCPVELLHLVLVAHWTLDVVKKNVLKKDDWVVAPYGGLEQGLGVPCRAARHQLDPGNALEVGLEPLGVLGAELPAHASGSANNHRHLVLAARGVVKHAAVV